MKIVLLIAGIFSLLAVARSALLHRTTICDGTKKTIQCPSGQVIKVQRAFYGRTDRNTCPHPSIHTTRCVADRSQDIIKETCHDHNSCVMSAGGPAFGFDPCYGTFKYVEVNYICQAPSDKIRAIICENTAATIRCPAGQAISVQRAFYGRDDSTTCGGRMRTTSCNAHGALAFIRGRCHGHTSCPIHASNSVFGDPCVGTYKYVEIVYSCIFISD